MTSHATHPANHGQTTPDLSEATAIQYGANGQSSEPSISAQIEASHVIDDDNPEMGVFPDEVWQRVAPDLFAKIQAGEQSALDNAEPLPDVTADEPSPTYQPVPTGNGYDINPPRRRSIADIMQEQAQQRGLEPLPLEPELLLKRIAKGGHSGQFLADAFLSAYRTDTPFQHSLGELIKLDAEGFRLFHQVLHIRHIRGWKDDDLYQLEQQIKAIVTEGK